MANPTININATSKESAANKQNSLAVDGTGVKFPTVDAVNSGLAGKQAAGSYATGTGTANGTNTGDETASTIGLIISNTIDITTIEDADKFAISDAGGAGNPLRYGLFSLIKSTLKTYFDSIYKATFTENTAFNKNFGTTTGTVAAGDDSRLAARYMTIQFLHFNFSPSDSTTYYLGRIAPASLPSTTASNVSFKTGVAGTIVEIVITVSNNTIQGSNENVTAKIRNITTATSSSSFGDFTTDATSTTSKIFNLSGSTSIVSATDEICVEITTPTWATNPTNIRLSGWILLKLT